MSNIIIVTGSARPNSVSHKVAPLVKSALDARGGITATIVDVVALQLPFFDAPFPPSHDSFIVDNPQVQAWTKLVAEADGVVLLTPEYNANATGIQKNAIDWIYKEWNGKPVAFIGYGWYDPSRAHEVLRVSFEQTLKAKLVEPFTQVKFMRDINTEGDILNQESVDQKFAATIDSFLENI